MADPLTTLAVDTETAKMPVDATANETVYTNVASNTTNANSTDSKSTPSNTTVVPPLPGRAGSTLEIAASLGIPTVDPTTGEPVSRNALKKRIREAREEIIAPLWRERRKQLRAARGRPGGSRRSHPRPPDDVMPPIDITLVLDCAYDDLMTDKVSVE
jgi:hypothetical protein